MADIKEKINPIADQLNRVKEAGKIFTEAEEKEYLALPDILEALSSVPIGVGIEVPAGYKRCGRCREVKKLYLFNRNSSSKINCSGNCKECQKHAAQQSYDKNKGKRDYKQYYADNQEIKRENGRKYYADHKEAITIKQKSYRGSSKGRKVMHRAHSKRKYMMTKNAGIPWTREMVIDRDKQGNEFPICYLCGEPIVRDSTLHMEHVIPIVLGGKDCFTNVACAHELCNLRKSKDAREITAEQVEGIIVLAEAYIDKHPELFPQFSEDANKTK